MAYAILGQRETVLTSRLNSYQLREMQVDDIQNSLALDQTDLQRQLSASAEGQASELGDLYGELADLTSDSEVARNRINAEINEIKEYYTGIEEDINQQVYAVQMKENIYDMEKGRLETQIEKVNKEMETVEKALSAGIEQATPNYGGQ
ncbi:hypothetical protein IJD44_10750 [bacterium]|nr:hypothetical protein [bacterium]